MSAKQVHFRQGMPEWKGWRLTGVSASAVSSLFDKNPYKTKRDLFFELSGYGEPEEEDKSLIYLRGHETEAKIRRLFFDQTKIEMEPTCFEKDQIFLASLDGYDKTAGILEAKLVGKEVLERARASGQIPENHWIQIQAQLHASDSDKAYWGALEYRSERGVVVELGRDEKFITEIRKKVFEFWDALQAGKAPALTAQDTYFITDASQIAIFERLSEIKAQKDAIEEIYSELEAQAKALASHSRIRCGTVTITEAERSGSIDYAKIPEIKALASEYLERFRKKPTRYKTIRFLKVE
jgi:putative phage-type endonuclease